MKRLWALASILIVAVLILTACPAPTPQVVEKIVKETVVVEKEKVVEKPVVQTQVVEKIVERKVEVTPKVTPAPEELSGTLIVGRGGDSVWLDVGPATDGESWRVVCEINDALVRQEGTTTKIIPWLATSWETKDSKTWVFHLRKGVTFHDGTPFNAEVVKWNMDRWRDPNNKWRFGRTFEYYDAEFGTDFAITDVKALGEYDVEVTLANPTALMLVKLSECGVFSMLSPKAVQEQGDKYGTPAGKAIGTGPFKFVEWISKDHITLERNESWWGGPPRLAKLIFRSIPDNSARFAELQAGTVQQADLAQTDLPAARKNPNLDVYLLPALSTGYIAFQQCTPPFDKLEVRQAIAAAVNWGALIKPFYGDFGELAGSFQPPTILGSNPDVKPYEYNPTKAKELLAKAGLPDGFTTDFWYIPVIRGYFPDSKAIGEAIAADLAKVGIKVNLKTEDWGAYLKDRNDGKFPMWMLGWGSDNGDPDNFLGWHFMPEAVGKPKKEDCYNNPKAAQLLIDGRLESDQAKREKIYQDAEKLIHDDVARIAVVWVKGTAQFRKEVKGYVPVVFRSWYEKLWTSKK
jgi:peptide/nickel transport system substrate-binding protein